MQYKLITPPEELKPFVKNFWFLDVDEDDIPFSHLLLPYAWFELFFYLSDIPHITIPENKDFINTHQSAFMGQLDKAINIQYHQAFRAVGISLQAWTGNALFGIPAHKMANQSIPLPFIEQSSFIGEQLLNAKDDDAIIDLLKKYIYNKLSNYRIDMLSATISDAIIQAPENDAYYKDVIKKSSYSRRRIEQKFLETIGTPMGQFLKTARFEKVIQTIEHNESLTLTQIGLQSGYYDQAHFSRNFKKLAGLTPKQYKNKLTDMDLQKRKFMIS